MDNSQVTQFSISILVSIASSGAFTWMLKLWLSENVKNSIKSKYDKEVETHKSQLKSQTDLELERARSQLAILSKEREVRFSKLHEKRASIMAELYTLLKDAQIKLSEYTTPVEPAGMPPREERRQQCAEAFNVLIDFYVRQKIFIPKPSTIVLDKIVRDYRKAYNEFLYLVDMNKDAQTLKWLEIDKMIDSEIRNAVENLEDEFRRILGDE